MLWSHKCGCQYIQYNSAPYTHHKLRRWSDLATQHTHFCLILCLILRATTEQIAAQCVPLYCSRYLNNAYRFYWRSMRLCYPNPPFSQPAKVLTKIALKGARVVLCTPVCNFLELGQFGSPNSKSVSKGCAWELFGGNIV